MKNIVIVVLILLIALSSQQDDVVFIEEPVEIEQEPIPKTPQIPTEQIVAKDPSITRSNLKWDVQTLKLFRNEILAIFFIFTYLFLYVRGKRANVEIMQKFYRKVDRYLENNFAHIGFGKVSGENPFIGDSPSEAIYYASGRDNVESIEMKFNTKKRQDLIFMIYDIFFPDRDTVTIDIPIKADQPLVLLIAQKKRVKEISENHLDIRKLVGKFGVTNLLPSYQVLGENADTVDSIVDNYVVRKLNEMNGLISSIHYSDQKLLSQSTGHLRAVLNISYKNSEHFQPALQLIFYLVDKFVSLKMPVSIKQKALKARQAFNQSKEKEELQKHNEQLRKKKQQKKRQEEAWLRSLPPQKQKRQDEKRKRKQFNKMMKGKSMKI